MILLQARQLSQAFGHRTLFGGLHVELRKGDFMSLLGPSGCGKSTLLRILAGLLKPSQGEVLRPSSRERQSLVFQEPRLLAWKNSYENIRLPFEVGALRGEPSPSLPDLDVLLRRLGLDRTVAQLFPHQLSGGMKMRVALARALVTNPSLLFLDEPFSALDEQTRFQLQDELFKIRHFLPEISVLFVTHSIAEAVLLSDRILLLDSNGHAYFNWQRPSSLALSSDARESDLYFHEVRSLSRRFAEMTQIGERASSEAPPTQGGLP